MEFFTVVTTIAVLTATIVYCMISRLSKRRSSWPKYKQSHAYTRKVTPKKKKLHLPLNSLDDFYPVEEATAVYEVVRFFAQRGNEFSVYSIDWEQEVVVLIRPVDGVDLKVHPFYREAQRRNAAEVLCVPFEQLPDIVRTIAKEVAHVQEIFIYMTGRCGSTLITRMVEATSVAQAANEPDVFSVISMGVHRVKRSRDRGRDRCPSVLLTKESIVDLLRNVVTLLNYNLVTSDPRHRPVIFYKLRVDVILMADLMRRAFPFAKTVFMYRNGVEVAESFKRINFRQIHVLYAAYRIIVSLGLWKKDPWMPDWTTCFGDDVRFSSVRHRGTFLFYAETFWVGSMHCAAGLQKSQPDYFFHAVIYYTALVNDREKNFNRLMKKLGLEWNPEDPAEDIRRMKKALLEDSQAGTYASSKTKHAGEKWVQDYSSRWSGKWEEEYNREVCRHAGNEITGPDFLLPDTIL